jgi:Flp pilus assembly protein TadG
MSRQRRHSFWHNERGGVAIFFGFALPVLLVGAGAAMEYSSLAARRTQLQKAADTAALAAANELKIATADDGRIKSVAQSVALSSLKAGSAADTTAVVQGQVIDKRTGVQVDIVETVSSVMGKALSLPTSDLRVTATARLASTAAKVCVVALNKNVSGAIRLDSNARLTANGCAVYSNSTAPSSVRSESNAVLSSTALICSSGGFKGSSSNYYGRKLTDCPTTPDPMANRPPPPVETYCQPVEKVEDNRKLNPGTYCKGLFIGANAKVTLNPGIYVIKDGPLKIDSNAEVYGRNVGFHFIGNNAHFEFTSNARVNIGAPKDGPMAGILFYGDPNASNDRTYKITSNYANHLIGTLYLPRGRFVIDASSPVADQSAWTALIANQIELYAQPNLVLNSNYDQSDVPVPQGLIQKGDARLAN